MRTDVANTRTQLDRTVADLRRVTGDMGVMSGLIATNQKEIDALRQLGDRNYTEFTVRKTKTPVKVGDVMVLLKKADAGRKRYTVELQADDSKIEKKDRAANEPGSILRGAQQAAARAGGESGSEGRGGRLPGDAEGRSRPPVTLSGEAFFDARQPHVHFVDLADEQIEAGVHPLIYGKHPVFQAGKALVEHTELVMAISKDLLEILVCPLCKAALEMKQDENGLKCVQCKRVYPIRDDIPVMLVDEARIEE